MRVCVHACIGMEEPEESSGKRRGMGQAATHLAQPCLSPACAWPAADKPDVRYVVHFVLSKNLEVCALVHVCVCVCVCVCVGWLLRSPGRAST